MDQLRVDVDAKALNALTEEDIGIWETPEGSTYVDGECPVVLAAAVLDSTHPPRLISARDKEKGRGTAKGKGLGDGAMGRRTASNSRE